MVKMSSSCQPKPLNADKLIFPLTVLDGSFLPFSGSGEASRTSCIKGCGDVGTRGSGAVWNASDALMTFATAVFPLA